MHVYRVYVVLFIRRYHFNPDVCIAQVRHLPEHSITVVTVPIMPSQAGNYQQSEQMKAGTETAVFFHRESSQLSKKFTSKLTELLIKKKPSSSPE